MELSGDPECPLWGDSVGKTRPRERDRQAVQHIAGVQLVRTPVNIVLPADAIGIPMIAAQFQISTSAAMDTLVYEAAVGT